jgi:hypothetical protein
MVLVAAVAATAAKSAAASNDHGDLALNELCRKYRQSSVLPLSPTIFDCDVLALGKSRLVQTAPKGPKAVLINRMR